MPEPEAVPGGVSAPASRQPRRDAPVSLHPVGASVCQSETFERLTAPERQRLSVLLGNPDFDMSERARAVFGSMCGVDGRGPPPVTVELLRAFLSSPRLLPQSADLFTRTLARAPSSFRVTPEPHSAPHRFETAVAEADLCALRVGSRKLTLVMPGRLLGAVEPLRPAGELGLPRYRPSRELVGNVLALVPPAALARVDRVVVEPRFPTHASRDWRRGRAGLARFAEHEAGTLRIFPQSLRHVPPTQVAALAGEVLYEICRAEGAERFGDEDAGWEPYLAAARRDELAPSSAALSDFRRDFGESRALYLLAPNDRNARALAELFPARWQLLGLLPATG